MEMLNPCIVIDIPYDVNIADWWVDRLIVLLMLAMCMCQMCMLFGYMCTWLLYLFSFSDWTSCLYFGVFEHH